MARRKVDYRKIWTSANGPIPKDEHGRSYEIHHVDGNRDNNELENLICISIVEHYNIHFEQKDYYACASISKRMKLTLEERILLTSKIAESNRSRVYTSECRAKLSEQSKGKMAVKCAVTGETIGRVATNHEKVLSGEWVAIAKGKKRPEHGEYMKSIGWGKTKTKEQIEKHKEAWLKTTGGTIRAMEWTIIHNNTEFKIMNLKKFCRDNNLKFSRLNRGVSDNGYSVKEKQHAA